MNISLRQLRAFVAVARQLSFTHAARELHLTQSAVSMLVRQLEAEMGLPLFDRLHRRVQLTDTGRELLPRAQRMLDDLRHVVEGAHDLRSLRRGRLRLCASQLLACTWLPPRLAAFSQAHPEVELQLVDTTADDVVGAVRRQEVDLGLGPERPTGDDIEAHYLRRVPMRLVVPLGHALAGRRRVRWQQVLDQRWIVYSADFQRALELALAQHDPSLVLRAASRVGYLTTALALVGQGLGVTAAPDYAGAMAAHFGLKFIALEQPAIERGFYLYRRRGEAATPAVEAFMALAEAG